MNFYSNNFIFNIAITTQTYTLLNAELQFFLNIRMLLYTDTHCQNNIPVMIKISQNKWTVSDRHRLDVCQKNI